MADNKKLTIAEAADLLGMTKQGVWYWVHEAGVADQVEYLGPRFAVLPKSAVTAIRREQRKRERERQRYLTRIK